MAGEAVDAVDFMVQDLLPSVGGRADLPETGLFGGGGCWKDELLVIWKK